MYSQFKTLERLSNNVDKIKTILVQSTYFIIFYFHMYLILYMFILFYF